MENTFFIYGTKAEDQGIDDLLSENLNLLLISILNTDISEQNHNNLLDSLKSFLKSSDQRQREGSMVSYIVLLKKFAAKVFEEKLNANGLVHIGKLIGELFKYILLYWFHTSKSNF